MSQLTNDKNLNLAATLVPSSTARGRAPLTGVLALGAALTLALFSGRAEAGLSGHNGMKVHNGISGHNGMKVHNGVTVSGTWLVRTINPARPLSAAVRARR